ncbi:MAG: hypothetical protein IJ859_01465 [Synergistaceae bacterium]|nr:hypothetical protein [Synergistaceae bacterium]MBR2207456.1 hypothetical protein [Synergistaceae bacterium]
MTAKLNTALISRMTGGLWSEDKEAEQAKKREHEKPAPVEEKSSKSLFSLHRQALDVKSTECSLRDFVKVISLPTRKQLYKSWFTVEDAIEAINEYEPLNGDNKSYILTEQIANEYLSLLVEKGYFEMQGNGRTARYRKICCSYQMDFWKEPRVN